MAAAIFIQGELSEREIAREKRDRVFWINQFGGKVPEGLLPQAEPEIVITERTEDEAIEMSPLGR